MIPLAIGVGVVVLLLVLLIPLAIKIVREYQRLMVFRLGRAIGAKGPGLVLLIPFVDKGVWVDLRELYLEIPHQAAITEDNATISIAAKWYDDMNNPAQKPEDRAVAKKNYEELIATAQIVGRAS